MKQQADSYGSETAKTRSLASVKAMLHDKGARQLHVKSLSPNDNSKNQIYLGSDFSALNIIPLQKLTVFESSSGKNSLRPGKKLIRGSIRFRWLDAEGQLHDAPQAKLVLYPQYPEVRFSGYLQGSTIKASGWMDVSKQGRAQGRYLLFGICPDGTCLGYLAVPGSAVAKELSVMPDAEDSLLTEIPLDVTGSRSHRDRLLAELRRIHLASPIDGKKLDRVSGQARPYKAANGAGYTLEAELGIFPNGNAEPDFDGWEIKAHSGTVLTLMTPEPDSGLYQTEGVGKFIRKHGYKDRKGQPDRLNFGGIHETGKRQSLTGLTLRLDGHEAGSRKFASDGGIVLLDDNDNIAAGWTFTKLLEHWNRKHARAAYVPCSSVKLADATCYRFADKVSLGEGTDFLKLLQAFASGAVWYDPGIKMEQASSSPRIKRRNQFRMHVANLHKMYEKWETVSL